MDVFQRLAELQSKLGNGAATPLDVADFLQTYGTKLEAIGMGGVVKSLQEAYDKLAGAYVKSSTEQYEKKPSVVTAGATGAAEQIQKWFGMAPTAPGDPPPIPLWVKFAIPLALVAVILFKVK